MDEIRSLTVVELNKIHNEEDLLKGNINRMCISSTTGELLNMYSGAIVRIKHIYELCLKKFINA